MCAFITFSAYLTYIIVFVKIVNLFLVLTPRFLGNAGAVTASTIIEIKQQASYTFFIILEFMILEWNKCVFKYDYVCVYLSLWLCLYLYLCFCRKKILWPSIMLTSSRIIEFLYAVLSSEEDEYICLLSSNH